MKEQWGAGEAFLLSWELFCASWSCLFVFTETLTNRCSVEHGLGLRLLYAATFTWWQVLLLWTSRLSLSLSGQSVPVTCPLSGIICVQRTEMCVLTRAHGVRICFVKVGALHPDVGAILWMKLLLRGGGATADCKNRLRLLPKCFVFHFNQVKYLKGISLWD